MRVAEIILYLMLTSCIVSLVWVTNYNCDSCKSCELIVEEQERRWLYNLSNIYMSGRTTNGLYYTDKGYCVHTKGRTEKEINRTDYHEYCHHLVYQDRKHFCD